MRLLLTSTLMAGVFIPLSAAWGQSVSTDAMGDLLVDQAQSTASETSTNTATDVGAAATKVTALPQLRGRIQYPVGPVAPVTPANQPVTPVQPLQGPGRDGDDEIDAYEAQGLKLGTFVLYPSISFTIEATDNIDDVSVGVNGQSGTTELELRAESDWSRHALSVTTRLGMTGYNEPNRKPDTEQFIDGSLELDLADQSKLTLTGSAQQEREAANSVELVASGGTAEIQSTFSTGAVLDQGGGIFRFQLRGAMAAESYEEDSTRDFQTFTFGGRTGFALTDQVTPFVDLEMSRKVYRQSTNTQNGDSLRGSIGLEVNNRETLSGEASIGLISWRPKISGQEGDSMLFADASLTWSPNALWSLTGGLETDLTSSSTGATSVATYTASFSASYAVRDNLDLGASTTLSREVYNGIGRRDSVFDGTLSAEYSFNRYSQLIASVGHERRNSTQIGSEYSENKAGLTLKFQR
ncbi:outer membrane beta-barrel protein [Cohaesibacter celericrescens]|uniref:outer membrane beta-barrel protein n=1 Tax=Cohaesibacter celericrescens TaxID=2067669 RepID=UPI00356424E1